MLKEWNIQKYKEKEEKSYSNEKTIYNEFVKMFWYTNTINWAKRLIITIDKSVHYNSHIKVKKGGDRLMITYFISLWIIPF